MVQQFVCVFTQRRSGTAVLDRRLGEPCEGTGEFESLAVEFDLSPVGARREMVVLIQIVHGRDGDEQQSPFLRDLEQLCLGFVSAERPDHFAAAEVLAERFLARENQRGVVQPVLVAGFLVAEALFQRVLHQSIGERSDRCAEEIRDRDMAIFAGPEELDFERSQCGAFGRTLERPGVVGRGQDARLGCLRIRGLG